MASDACIPIKVALQLMDPSSLGLADQHDQFQEVHTQLQNALKVVVNEHHQGFNSSIGTFHKIQAAIHASQSRVRQLKSDLVSAKSALGTHKPELKALATGSQEYDAMLAALGVMEQLQLVPERLEAQISEKRFLGAVDTLKEALRLIRKPEMEELGALSDLRVYLSNQEHSLTDILIEELHSHLYLKSPYCEERWKAHMKREGATNGTFSEDDERAMHRFLESYDGTNSMQEDASRNPEADTFYYIQLLVESLNRMLKLDVAVDAIEQRLPVELFRVVERSHSEVEQRHPSTMRNSAAARNRPQGLMTEPDGERKATLEDLLTTLYAKFETIAEGHRVLHDVTAAIIKRERLEDAAMINRSFRELWKLLQSEIRSLLHDHLATNDNLSRRSRHQHDSSARIFKPQPRDRNRRMFKLSDMADGSNKSADLATEREDLEFILKASVPGLVNANAAAAKKDGREGQDGSTISDRSATGHKLLVEPSVFNMGILLPPSLTFLTNLKAVVPPHSSVARGNLTAFLDDFLINVFHPQLDETLFELCHRASTGEADAFQSDAKWDSVAQKPVFKGTVKFFELVEAFCRMLDALPHDQSFSQLVITQMRAYYDRCYQWSKGLLQRVQMSASSEGRESGGESVAMRLAADLATSGEVCEVVIELLKAQKAGGDEGKKEADVLATKEAELLLRLCKRKQLEEADLINDRKALAALCTLQVSMKWLASRCQQLRFISPRAVDTANTSQQSTHHQRRWTTTHAQAPSGAYLPLDPQTAQEFDAVILSFTELSTLVLRTLHIDLRLHLLQGVYKAMDTTYALDQPYNDPDPSILTLSNSLGTYDAQLTAHLLPTQYTFLTQNLHVLAVSALTGLVSSVPAMDSYGNARMQLNVLVLQQTLKGLEREADLGRVARFYELGALGPEAVVTDGPGEGFAREDLKALVRLCYLGERDGGVGSVEAFVGRL